MTDAVPPGDAPGENQMRASDADRERVAEVLRDAMAEGRLDMDEFQERLEAVYQARTYGELAPITRDLPSAPGGAGAGVAPVSMAKSPAPATGRGWAARIGGRGSSTGAFAFWSGFQRKGRWTMPRLFRSFTIMGGGEIDLREASFEAREVTIQCYAFMGGVQVTVPPGLNVRITGFGIMGGFAGGEHFYEDGDPDAPTVTITGVALMGGVGVERKLPRGERKRLKEESRREYVEGRDERRAEIEGAREERRRAHEARREHHREQREYHRERRDSGRYGDRRDY